MAIYFPRLFCDIDQRLLVKEDIVFSDGTIISKGEYCIVKDIKGYGFDIITEKDEMEIRIMNSEMERFFIKEPSAPSVQQIYKTVVFQNLTIHLTGGKIGKDDSTKFRDVLMFAKDFTIKDVITIRYGERFYYEVDNGYYDLFDVNDGWRSLRMKEKEVQEFCQLQDAAVNEFEPV